MQIILSKVNEGNGKGLLGAHQQLGKQPVAGGSPKEDAFLNNRGAIPREFVERNFKMKQRMISNISPINPMDQGPHIMDDYDISGMSHGDDGDEMDIFNSEGRVSDKAKCDTERLLLHDRRRQYENADADDTVKLRQIAEREVDEVEHRQADSQQNLPSSLETNSDFSLKDRNDMVQQLELPLEVISERVPAHRYNMQLSDWIMFSRDLRGGLNKVLTYPVM